MKGLVRALSLALILLVCLGTVVAEAQGPLETARIQQMIDRMSVEERVGQLFLVTFQGADSGPNSDVTRLIRDLRVGGVVISPANGNLRNDGETGQAANDAPRRVAELTNALQTLAL